MRLFVDWDQTLVDEHGEWIPGAVIALRQMSRNHKVIIHSARANWDGGIAEIAAKLKSVRVDAPIVAKPDGDIYIDDKAMTFGGNWAATLKEIRSRR